jgi:hypothetical protein
MTQEREAYGHKFQLREGTSIDQWRSTRGDGHFVMVIPPNIFSGDRWTVYASRHIPTHIAIEGERAQERAFSVAVGFIEQQ